jgi:hypothetical protein
VLTLWAGLVPSSLAGAQAASGPRPWPGLFAAQASTPDLWPVLGSIPSPAEPVATLPLDRRLALSVTGVARLGAGSAACDAGGTPDIAACAGVALSEVGALRKLACLLDAFNRWRLQVIACTQAQIDTWQQTVMWPTSGLRAIGSTLRRVRTLREEIEDTLKGWSLGEPVQSWATLAYTPRHADRGLHESVWGPASGAGRDVQELAAWHSTLVRNALQARTNGAFGEAGEIPESTWERIGREGARQVGDQRRDALSALRLTPQLGADRLRVEIGTARLQAHMLTTLQIQRDMRRLRRAREWSLGSLWLDTLVQRPQQGR